MDQFPDYYEILQISPSAELAIIERVHRLLATRYHPDNPRTGDTTRFVMLQEAYEVLSDAKRRADYDADYKLRRPATVPVIEQKQFFASLEAEVNRRLSMLCLLYTRRRDDASHPAISSFDLQAMLAVTREQLEFSSWYLREKGYVRRDDHGELSITAEGIDYVEERQRDTPIMQRLLMPPASGVNGHSKSHAN